MMELKKDAYLFYRLNDLELSLSLCRFLVSSSQIKLLNRQNMRRRESETFPKMPISKYMFALLEDSCLRG
jgi:hypothetical protein